MEKKDRELKAILSEINELAQFIVDQFKNPGGDPMGERIARRSRISELRLRSITFLVNASYQDASHVAVAFDLLDKLYEDCLSITFFHNNC